MCQNIQNKMAFSQEQAAENKHSILKKDEVLDAKLLKEPGKCVAEELKRWLECQGFKKSGKKAECIKRVKDGLKLNFPVYPKIDGGKWYNLKTEDSASIENISSKTSIASLGDLPTDDWRLFPSKNLHQTLIMDMLIFISWILQPKQVTFQAVVIVMRTRFMIIATPENH